MKLKFKKTEPDMFGIKKRIFNFRGIYLGKIRKGYLDINKKPVPGSISLSFFSMKAFYEMTPEQLKQIQAEARTMKYIRITEEEK